MHAPFVGIEAEMLVPPAITDKLAATKRNIEKALVRIATINPERRQQAG